jgi:hypothetical protein
MTRPSFMCGILVSCTWHGTRFKARSNVVREEVMREVAQSRGSGVGKVSYVNMWKDSCSRHANG